MSGLLNYLLGVRENFKEFFQEKKEWKAYQNHCEKMTLHEKNRKKR